MTLDRKSFRRWTGRLSHITPSGDGSTSSFRRLELLAYFVFVAVSYLFVETRYPALNFDDTYFLAGVFPSLDGKMFQGGFHELLFNSHTSINEFRTYALARTVHFLLFKMFGVDLLPYFMVMASMGIVTAGFVSRYIFMTTRSTGTAIAVFFGILASPFFLFQTFHHAAYILMPMVFMSAYLCLLARNIVDAWRKTTGPLLCLLTVLSGEVAAVVLICIIVMHLVPTFANHRKAERQALLAELSTMILVVLLLFVHYRVYIFNPGLAQRFGPSAGMSIGDLGASLVGFNSQVGTALMDPRVSTLLSYGTVFDGAATTAIVLAGVATIMQIAVTKENNVPWSYRARLLAGVWIIYLVSSASYIVASAQQHENHFPLRYLHLSGIIGLTGICVGASLLPRGRRLALACIVAVCMSSAVLTYAIKLPTLEGEQHHLEEQIIALKGTGRVVFQTPRDAGGYFNPYWLQPASSPYTEWWILANYCPLILHLPCGPGQPRSGDIVVTPVAGHEGYLTTSSVRREP